MGRFFNKNALKFQDISIKQEDSFMCEHMAFAFLHLHFDYALGGRKWRMVGQLWLFQALVDNPVPGCVAFGIASTPAHPFELSCSVTDRLPGTGLE